MGSTSQQKLPNQKKKKTSSAIFQNKCSDIINHNPYKILEKRFNF